MSKAVIGKEKPQTIGVLALARVNFDVNLAKAYAAEAFATLDRLGVETIGPRQLIMDEDALENGLKIIEADRPDRLLVLQVTFTDAASIVEIAERLRLPMLIWAWREERTGGRLRLNSFCGLNLAAHALARAGHDYEWLYEQPTAADALQVRLEANNRQETDNRQEARPAAAPSASSLPAPRPSPADQTIEGLAERIGTLRVGLVGDHPQGFDTCRYDRVALRDTFGIQVDRIALDAVFQMADATSASTIQRLYGETEARLAGLEEMDRGATERSLAVYAALKHLATDHDWDGIAVRCWPEFFTQKACAACGAMARLADERIPTACEADVLGTITNLILQEIGGSAAFLTDLVDVDAASDSAVLWHCGLAPLSMAASDEPPRATLHANRKLPLLNEFALKPGRITIARLSQAKNTTKLVIAAAEVLAQPRPFGGTAGVIRFDRDAAAVMTTILDEGLEHHYSIVYGDHAQTLEGLAAAFELPVLHLS